jgi:hypothetical protein
MACGENTASANKYYVASSQRYGCNTHLKLEARGKCLVVYTGDAGPASFVERKAGVPVLDSSPAVAKYFFGRSGLGWSDLSSNPRTFEVNASVTDLPLGPCSAGRSTDSSGTDPAAGDDTGRDPGVDTSGGSSVDTGGGPSVDTSGGSSVDTSGGASGGTSPSGGGACANDGDCNPGSDGSGMICQSGTCVPGCHHSYQCPGAQRCVSGECQ